MNSGHFYAVACRLERTTETEHELDLSSYDTVKLQITYPGSAAYTVMACAARTLLGLEPSSNGDSAEKSYKKVGTSPSDSSSCNVINYSSYDCHNAFLSPFTKTVRPFYNSFFIGRCGFSREVWVCVRDLFFSPLSLSFFYFILFFSNKLIYAQIVMSLFARTTADLATANELFEKLSVSSASIDQRKRELDDLLQSLEKISVATNKFVLNADAGEADPNKRLYGKGMVAKIRALKSDLDDFRSRIDRLSDAINNEFTAWAKKKASEELEAKERLAAAAEQERLRKLEEEKIEREREERERAEQQRIEKEKMDAKDRELREKVEKDRIAQQKAEEERLAAQKAQRLAEDERAQKEHAERLEIENSMKKAAENSISITIKTSKGKSFALEDVDRDSSILELKRRIERTHDIPIGSQRLIYQGRLLDDRKTPSDCNIESGMVVHLVENSKASSAVGHQVASSADVPPVVPPGTVQVILNGKCDFDRILASCGTSRLLVVDWSASWCAPCRMISAALGRLAVRFSDVSFITIETDQTPQNSRFAEREGISAYPTFHFYVARHKVHEFSGANASQIEASIRRFRPTSISSGAGTSSSASTSSVSSSSSSAAAGSLTSRVMAALGALRSHCSEQDFIVAVRTLLTFVRNVVDHPHDPKYQRVRTGNNAYQSRVARHGRYGTECMLAFGFESITENGEQFLVLPASVAINPELRRVKSQLEAAMQAAGITVPEVASGSPGEGNASHGLGAGGGSQGFAHGTRFTDQMGTLLGGTPGNAMGPGMTGMPPIDFAVLHELMTDPAFQEITQELNSSADIADLSSRVQAALQSGDPAAAMQLASDPTLARMQQLLARNPSVLERMMRAINSDASGNGMQPFGGVQGSGNVTGSHGGLGYAPRSEGNQGGTGFTTPTQAPRPSPVPPPAPRHGPAPDPPLPTSTRAPAGFPGAPTTQEEEERLLQEAIRLSMEDASKKNDEASSRDHNPEDGESGSNN